MTVERASTAAAATDADIGRTASPSWEGQSLTGVPNRDAVLEGLVEELQIVLDPDDLARIDLNALEHATPLLSLPLDSLALMELMTRVEDRFRVYISQEQAYAFVTIADVLDHVHEKALAKARRRTEP